MDEYKPILGPMGKYPDGKIREDDNGEITTAVFIDPKSDRIILDFGGYVKWIGMGPKEAVDLANTLLRLASTIKPPL